MCKETGPGFGSVAGESNLVHKLTEELKESVYAASELFNAGAPEKMIQDCTGHGSLDGLQKYERISEEQKEAACKVLAVRPEACDKSKLTSVNVPLVSDSFCYPGSLLHHTCT